MNEDQGVVLADLDPVSRDRLLLESYEHERTELEQQARRTREVLRTLQQMQEARESQVRALTLLIERTRKRLSDGEGQVDDHHRSDAPTDQEGEAALISSASKKLVRLALDSPAEDLSDRSRTAAVSRVLERSSEPLAPAAIAGLLSEAGRDDEPSVVSAALDYLRRKKRAHRVGFGQWMAGPEPDSDEAGATFDAASGTATAPRGGDATHALGRE